jgi:TRAP-type C4-dicarboxylate transport system permease small subunit
MGKKGMMTGSFRILQSISKYLSYLAGIALTFMMLLTVADILLRSGGHPIIGTYEISALALALVIGFGIPQVSLDKGHVYMEFLLEKLSVKAQKGMNTLTRLMCLIMFAFIAYNLILVGNAYKLSGEVTATIKLPFYPVAYAVSACCFLECIVFLFEIIRIWRKPHE